MQLPITTLLAILSASAIAIPTNTTIGPMPSANAAKASNGLPYGNSTQSYPNSTDPSNSHNINDLEDPHYRYEHHIATNYTSEDSMKLIRRNNYFADIASYSDGICTILVGEKTTLHDSKCIKFQPDINAAFIGINWGSGRLVTMQKMNPYTDDKCKDGIHNGTIVTPHEGGMMPMPSAGWCRPYQEWLNKGGPWKSGKGQ